MLYGSISDFPDGRRVWLIVNGDGGISVMSRDFPGAAGFAEVEDTPENRAAGALPKREALDAHSRAVNPQSYT